MKTSLLKSAVRNNDIEPHVSKLIELLFIRGSYTVCRDVLESRQIGKAFKLVSPKQRTKHQFVMTTLSVLINLLVC